jgi:hypothetical protein
MHYRIIQSTEFPRFYIWKRDFISNSVVNSYEFLLLTVINAI